MVCLFVRISTEKSCTDVAVILRSPGCRKLRGSDICACFLSGYLCHVWIFLKVRLVFLGIENPPLQTTFFFFSCHDSSSSGFKVVSVVLYSSKIVKENLCCRWSTAGRVHSKKSVGLLSQVSTSFPEPALLKWTSTKAGQFSAVSFVLSSSFPPDFRLKRGAWCSRAETHKIQCK